MGKKLPPRQLELYQAIDEILWKDWDPIGVSGMDGPRDEYQMYLPQVYRLALKGDHRKIVDYLFSTPNSVGERRQGTSFDKVDTSS